MTAGPRDGARGAQPGDGARGAPLVFRPLPGLPEIAPGADLAELCHDAARAAGIELAHGVLALCQKVVSKAEGRLLPLATLEPRAEAVRIAEEDGKDPRHIEAILRETKRVVRRGKGVLICETAHGFVCANAGVDLSNAPEDDVAVLLPVDPDASAERIRAGLLARGAGPLGVLVTDTFGRPWREGLVDVALGCAGFQPLDDLRGSADRRGRTLQVTAMATADALAAAAGLLMRKDAGLPAVWIAGVALGAPASARVLLRDAKFDLFR